MSARYFHFTLGPVQGFVSQARRTRDFWAGSFLLSWLSAIAMRSVEAQQGKVLFPKPDPKFMLALEQGQKGPAQGSIPNRFKAEVDDNFEPDRVLRSVRQAWSELAEKVWLTDFQHLTDDSKHKRIWNQQVTTFWDMQWVLTEDENDTDSLDRLKNWRTHLPPDQPGLKCMMMDGWQELSGIERPNRDERNAFWETLREQNIKGVTTDLRDGEMLCAIAYVKRRFIRAFENFSTHLPDWTVHGWALPNSAPSVHYMAAAHWLKSLIKLADADPKLAQSVWSFHNDAEHLTREHGEWASNIRCIKEAPGPKKWKALNGEVFFESMLENARLWRKDAKDQQTPAEARQLARTLSHLRQQADLPPVTPFYSVLLMDGDELGKHMSRGKPIQDHISDALATFTSIVPGIVDQHNGFLVYAGGDDVLAILPMENALSCAQALHDQYAECFDTTLVPSTLSGAIEYAHAKMPLGKILADAHDLLDNIAKHKLGRDTIACRVWKPGGRKLEWAMPWRLATDDQNIFVEQLARVFQEESTGESADFTNTFFYRLRTHFDMLTPSGDLSRSAPTTLHDMTLDLMTMEYLNCGPNRNRSIDDAKHHIAALLEQCQPRQRPPQVTSRKTIPPKQWPPLPANADAALLVRFLATKGID